MISFKKYAILIACVSIVASYTSPSFAQPKQFDDDSYKRVMSDLKKSMSNWHSGFVARMSPAADDVIVEALNFYSYGNPSGPEQILSATEADTGWKNVGDCLYQRVITKYNDDRSFAVRGRSALLSVDFKKIDWNSSSVKSEYNTLINQRTHRVTLASRSNDFYNQIVNFVEEGDIKSRRFIIGNVESAPSYEAVMLDTPVDRIQKSLSLAKARCGGIKSSF